jgi:hypothetical protein
MNERVETNRPLSPEETSGYEQTLCPGEDDRECGRPTVATKDAKQHERIYSEPYDYHGFDWMYIGCSCGLISIWQAYTKMEWRCPNDR